MHAITTPDTARRDAMQEDNPSLLVIANRHRADAQVRQLVRHHRQLMIMGGKERSRHRLIMQMFNDGARYRQSIVGAGAAPDLVEDDQTMPRGEMQDSRRLFHLDHEGALARSNIVFRSHTRKNAIYQTDARPASRDEAADLRQQGD